MDLGRDEGALIGVLFLFKSNNILFSVFTTLIVFGLHLK
ncbi:hypothetical protein CHCC20348_4142 [Bacillus paralicheniformis]|nr:hypothetical protein CHCC20348_4142 [Bacillus paralicheniformis]